MVYLEINGDSETKDPDVKAHQLEYSRRGFHEGEGVNGKRRRDKKRERENEGRNRFVLAQYNSKMQRNAGCALEFHATARARCGTAAAGTVETEPRKSFFLLGSVSVLMSSRRTLRPTQSAHASSRSATRHLASLFRLRRTVTTARAATLGSGGTASALSGGATTRSASASTGAVDLSDDDDDDLLLCAPLPSLPTAAKQGPPPRLGAAAAWPGANDLPSSSIADAMGRTRAPETSSPRSIVAVKVGWRAGEQKDKSPFKTARIRGSYPTVFFKVGSGRELRASGSSRIYRRAARLGRRSGK
jgi:hypothetical protein